MADNWFGLADSLVTAAVALGGGWLGGRMQHRASIEAVREQAEAERAARRAHFQRENLLALQDAVEVFVKGAYDGQRAVLVACEEQGEDFGVLEARAMFSHFVNLNRDQVTRLRSRCADRAIADAAWRVTEEAMNFTPLARDDTDESLYAFYFRRDIEVRAAIVGAMDDFNDIVGEAVRS
jgi:uncharacterized membrane protein